jgi:hypothetical protein
MENLNDIIDKLVEEIDLPDDVPVMYEVWAIGYDEEECPTDAELLIGTFEDPDAAVSFARDTAVSDILGLAEDEDYTGFNVSTHTIHVEVETVISDEENCTLNIGTVYKKTLELFTEVPDFVCLSNDEYEVIEETGYIQIPRHLVKEFNKNDVITILFEDEEEPWPIEYKVISKTDDCYICEFV